MFSHEEQVPQPGGNHPGYTLGRWLSDYEEQVLLFAPDLAVD